MKKRNRGDRLFLCLAAALLTLGGGALILFPAPRFSARENRYLTDPPAFTREALFSGEYTATLDTYTAERLPCRQILRGVRALTELALGKREVDGILLCHGGTLVRLPTGEGRTYTQNKRAQEKIEALCAASGIPCTAAILPQRITVAGTPPALMRARAESERTGLSAALGEEAYWYRTDHHWTTAGAYAAYNHLAASLGYTPYTAADFTPVTVSDVFFGTSDAAAGIPFLAPDSIALWRYEGDTAFRIRRNGTDAALTGFYDLEKLQTRDGYGVFFGGNDALLEIDLGEGDTRPVLLVIKDSFANALLPFLARHYRLIAVDPRYGCPSLDRLLPAAHRVLLLCGKETLESTAFFGGLIK